MLRRFVKDSAVYGLNAVLSRGMNVLLVPLYARALTQAENGLNDMLMGVMLVVSVVSTLGSSQGVTRYLADPLELKPGEWASTAMTISFMGMVLASLVVAVTAGWWAPGVGVDGGFTIGWLVFTSACALGVGTLTTNALRATGKPNLYSVASICGFSFALVMNIILTGQMRWGLKGVFVAQTLGAALSAMVGWWFQRSLYSWQWSGVAARRILRFSLPLVPGSVGLVAMMYANRFVIGDLLSVDAAGRYGMVNRVSLIAGVAMMGVGGALAPLVYARHRDPDTPRQLARLLHVFTGVACVVVAGLALLAREILPLLGAGNYVAWAHLAYFQAPAVMLGQMYVFFPGAAIAGRTVLLTMVTLSAAALNVALCYALVPGMHLTGAALASLISASASLAAHAWLSHLCYSVPHRRSSLLLAMGITGVTIAFGAGLGGEVPWDGFWRRMGLVVVCAAGCAAALQPWKMIRR